MAVAAPKSPSSTQPPEEQFWLKYSPNHEAPISGVSSIVLHVAAIGFMVLFGLYVLNRPSASDPLSVAAIQYEDGGGGGSPDGDGNNKGTASPKEAGAGDPKGNTTKTDPDPDPTKLNPVNPDDPVKIDNSDPNERLVSEAMNISKGLVSFSKDVNQEVLAFVKPKGQGGTGTGGGEGTGTGTGTGSGTGSGKGNVNVRQKRVLRWTLTFETRTGEDYRQQLKYFDAILATPTKQSGKYLVYKSLNKGEQGTLDDLGSMNRIFWVDSRPDSVASLANAMGMRAAPKEFIAFFPVNLEERLLKLEQDFHRKREEDIGETRFIVKRNGKGYTVEVEGGH